MGSVTVDYSGLDALQKMLKQANKRQVKVGWFESAKYDDNTPVAGIAAQNEYGNPNISIPARPFVRPAIADNKQAWAKSIDTMFKRAAEGKTTATAALSVLGDVVASDIKTAIVNGNHAPLSPLTIALRKHRNDGAKIGGRFIGAVAAAIARGETGSGQLGDQSFGNTDPLRETGYMIATLTSEVN
jgi:hypothetical protein